MPIIPNKLYFRIGEVSKLIGVEPYVLRYWESEFKMVNPSKSRSRQRLYRKADVELIFKIKELLYEEGYTIKGARALLRKERQGGAVSNGAANGEMETFLKKLHTELSSLQKMIAGEKTDDLFAQ